MKEREILENLKTIVKIGEMGRMEFKALKESQGFKIDDESIDVYFYAMKLGCVIGKIDHLIFDIESKSQQRGVKDYVEDS